MSGRRLLSAVILVTLAACGGPLKYEVRSSETAPGADAKIVADVNKEQNQTELKVHANNLPPPSRVVEGSNNFVAWYRKDSKDAWTRIGSMEYDEGDRKAKLNATTPETSFDIAISVEKEPSPASPSPDIVFSQHIN
ncbi:MAG TPA: hypothetical protein VM580_15990 [Labilithrix sp.]|nr:hypothetical protein [Labilithrix sp.]